MDKLLRKILFSSPAIRSPAAGVRQAARENLFVRHRTV